MTLKELFCTYYELICYKLSIQFKYIDYEDIRDIVIESIVKAYEYRNSYNKQFTWYTYIYTIAKRKAIDNMRLHKNSKVHVDCNHRKIRSSYDLENMVNKNMESELLHKAIEELPVAYKEVIILHYFDEKRYKEIQEQLQLDINNIKTRLRRAKIKLKNKLEGQL